MNNQKEAKTIEIGANEIGEIMWALARIDAASKRACWGNDKETLRMIRDNLRDFEDRLKAQCSEGSWRLIQRDADEIFDHL